jgi:hypothetical protein
LFETLSEAISIAQRLRLEGRRIKVFNDTRKFDRAPIDAAERIATVFDSSPLQGVRASDLL